MNKNLAFLNFFLIDLQSWPKKVNQIKNNIACVVASHVFVFRLARPTSRCNPFPHVFGNRIKDWSFYPNFQAMLFIVAMLK